MTVLFHLKSSWMELYSKIQDLEISREVIETYIKQSWNEFKIENASKQVVKYFPLFGLVVLFWPVIVTLILVFASASGWMFWILTSLIFGFIQLFYVIYQFGMVSLDIIGLSFLKTFAMLRAQLLHHSPIKLQFNKRNIDLRERRRKASQRKNWRRRLYATNSFKDYDQIQIQDADDPTEQTFDTYSSSDDPNQPKKNVKRSQSCSNLRNKDNVKKNDGHNDESSLKSVPFSRSNSYLGKSTPDINSIDDPDGELEYRKLVENQMGNTGGMLIATTKRLREARIQAGQEGDISSLKFLLSGVVKRNHLSVDEMLRDDSRSVANNGQYLLPKESKEVIEGYMDEVVNCLDWIADSPTNIISAKNSKDMRSEGNVESALKNDQNNEAINLNDRIKLLHKLKQNTGCTALMLSGGGAQAMYHLGTIKALAEANLYQKLTVISGTSGGSIAAAMCATKTPKELLEHVCVPNVSTNFMNTGQMKRENIRWFPTLMEMGTFWMKNKLLVDSKDFKKCCDFYYGDITFEEAFQRTGKHVCITVSASRASSGGAQRLLLNHISTPHVTLSSAVGASCALPGVMAPAKLMAKDSEGNIEPFEVDGLEWIDGSVQADLPFRRISTLFNVSEYIVCQCNFHVLPFLNKAHHPSRQSLYWRIFQTFEWDIRNRALNLSRLGLFPKIFGQDISKVFKQKYHGNLTLVPRFTKKQLFGLQALSNPTFDDMKAYIKYGQIAAFPYVSVIEHMLRFETAIDSCITRIEARRDSNMSDDASFDGSAISSMSWGMFKRPFLYSARKDSERYQRKNEQLERENQALKKKIEMLEQAMGLNLHEDKNGEIANAKTKRNDGEKSPLSFLSDTSEEGDWAELRHRQGRALPDIPFVEVK